MTAEDLRHQFHNEQGISWENSQGEPDIDYVMWLEQKVIRLKAKMPSEEEIEKAAYNFSFFPAMPDGEPTPDREMYDAFIAGAEWFRNRMTSSEKPNNLTEGGEG